MAELILSPIVTVVIEMLGSATLEKLGSLWGVEDDLKDLKESLLSIQAVLLNAEEKQSHDHQVRHWLQRLEDVVNEADDLFNEVATEGLRRQLAPATTWKKIQTSPARLKFRYNMAIKIRNIKNKMAKIAADRKYFNLVESRDEIVRPVGSGREIRSFVDEEQVVGRVGDKRKLLELMMNLESRVGQERVSVIPIVGMGGLGKTTLAQLIFDDGRVKDHFNPRIWVCVSDDFDEKTIVGKIVESITGMCTRDATLGHLQKTLQERIAGKRYFLVLDDVWSEEWKKWKNIKDLLLNCGEPGSTIVVTTRIDRVAKLSSEVPPYRLGILNKDESWSLFEKIAFKNGKEPSEVSVEIGKKIVKKCGGLPLAITMIARMLSELEPETKWLSIDKELSSITQKDGDILPTLRLSYNSLPPNLKHCFAYCSLFPKDYEFDVETLVTLWIAQGFIGAPSDRSQSLEDVGYDYFLELASRSFFQELEVDEVMDKVVRCKMHDLVHDLAIQVGGEKYARLDHGSKPNALEKALHASLGWRESMPSSLLHAKKLRSFIRPWMSGYGESELRGEVALDFRLLRMLDLHNSQINNEKLKSIGVLKFLRYLDLSENGSITRLPTSITKLVNLQTLKLTGCRNLCELPTDIGKLVNLRHLTWSNKELFLPRGVRQLINLRTLSYLTLSEDPTHITLDELWGLDNLRGCVDIQEIRNGMKVNGAILKEKELVRSLKLCWSNPDICGAMRSANQEVEETLEGLQPNQNLRALTVQWYGGIKFSDWLSSLRNLVELKLESCFKLKQLSSLESLCSLRKMHIDRCDEMEYIVMDINGDGALEAPIHVFSSLQHMVLKFLYKFKGWKSSNITENEDEGVQLLSLFPCLTSLEVWHCPELISMPLFPNVKELTLENTNHMVFEQTVTAYLGHPQISQASATACSSSPSLSSPPRFYPLIKVRTLCLCCRNKADVHYFPDWMQSLSCLEKLEISESTSFSLIGGTMSWIIKEGDEHQMSIGGKRIGWEIFSGVRELILQGVSILKHVSIAAQYFTTLENLVIQESEESRCEALPILHKEVFSRLKSLTIEKCDNLSGIPSWIFKLSSLQQLQILGCKKLESMPASLNSLTSLQSLKIYDCPSLNLLTVDEYGGIKFSDGLSTLRNLVELELKSCLKLKQLSSLELLCSLRKIGVSYCNEMEDIVMDINGDGALEAPIPVFSSLQHMVLMSLDTFKGWKCSNEDGVQLLSYFPCLTSLVVSHCPKLISMPLYPNVKELYLENTNQMPFDKTVTAILAYPQISQAPTTTCSSSSSPPRYYPLSQVRNLCLCCHNITDVQYFPDWMQSFSCLETLEFSESKSFSLTSGTMSWIIKEGDEHQMSTGGNQIGWEIFSGVRELRLRGVSIIKHVSLAALYFTTLENLVILESEDLDFSWEGLPILHKEMFSRLKSLSISWCDNLSGIPKWTFKLSSLQHVEIFGCETLESMPASLSSLTSLQSLTIDRCPILTLDDEIEWGALVSLHSLILSWLPKLVTLPSGLQHATTLQTLRLHDCENLSALPDWICNLSSLQRLEIYRCPKIESLPRSIKSLSSFKH